MGTYADYFNEHYGGDVASGPVRVTIARAENDLDGSSDVWEVEELMEHEESGANADAPNTSTTDAAVRLDGIVTSRSSVWVIDT